MFDEENLDNNLISLNLATLNSTNPVVWSRQIEVIFEVCTIDSQRTCQSYVIQSLSFEVFVVTGDWLGPKPMQSPKKVVTRCSGKPGNKVLHELSITAELSD